MVAVSSSGEIFTLSAAGAADADGWVRAAGRGQVSGDVIAELSLCHGITAAVGAEVVAEAEARLGALWFLAASGQVDASAQADAFARAVFSGNVFDDFGAVLGVGASASAGVAAQGSAGFDAVGAARAAEALFGSGVLLDLFTAFLNEVRLEGGARASISAGASARAVVGLSGNLLDDPARFEIAAEADAAAGVGSGVKAYVLCEIADPRRMALTMSELAATEIAAIGREHVPEPQHFLLDWFELLAPVATGVVWELAQETTLSALGPPELLADRVVDAVLGRLQTLLLDRAVDAGFAQATELLRDAAYEARLRADDGARLALANAVGALADGLPNRNLSLLEIGELAGALLDLFDPPSSGNGAVPARTLRRPLTLLWTAAAAAIALRDPGATASAEVRVIGAGQVAGTAAAQLDVPPPPNWVRAEWAVALGHPATGAITFADCVDALVALGLARALAEDESLTPLLAELGMALGLTAGELVETIVALQRGTDLRGTPVYQSLRDVLGRAVDDLLVGRLLPLLRANLPDGSASQQWLEEAAVPSLLGVRGFVLGRVDSLVGGAIAGDQSAFLNEFRTALGMLGGKVVVRNLLVLQWVLEDHVRSSLPDQLRELAAAVDAGDVPPALAGAVTAWRQLVNQFVPPIGVDADLIPGAARRLLAGLIALAADVTEVEPASRRNRRRQVQAEAMRVDDLAVDYASSDEVLELVRSVMDCNGIPDVGAAVEFAVLQVQTLADQAVLVVTEGAPLLLEFFAELSGPVLRALAEGFADFVSGLERARTQAIAGVKALDRMVQDAADDMAAAAREYRDRLRELRRLLRSEAERDRALERIRSGARAEAVEFGGDAMGVAFDGVWAVASFVVDPALDVLGAAAGVLADILDDVASAADAVAALSEALSDFVVDAMLGVDLQGLADFLGVDDLAEWVAEAASRGSVHTELTGAGRARRDERDARSRQNAAEQQRGTARAEKRAADQRLDAVSRTRIAPRILAPAALHRGQLAVHQGSLTLRVALPGGDQRLLATGQGRRLEVRLNGRVLRLTAADLAPAIRFPIGVPGTRPGRIPRPGGRVPSGVILVRPLAPVDGLRTGLNVVEVAVLATDGPLVDRVSFLWLPGVQPRSRGLGVDMAQCRFDVTGNDHLAPEDEFVCLVNESAEPIDVAGWRVADRAGHSYVFESGRLAPGRRLRLHTGRGADTATRRYWGRRRAVWNNPWEPVVLVSPAGVVQTVTEAGGAW